VNYYIYESLREVKNCLPPCECYCKPEGNYYQESCLSFKLAFKVLPTDKKSVYCFLHFFQRYILLRNVDFYTFRPNWSRKLERNEENDEGGKLNAQQSQTLNTSFLSLPDGFIRAWRFIYLFFLSRLAGVFGVFKRLFKIYFAVFV